MMLCPECEVLCICEEGCECNCPDCCQGKINREAAAMFMRITDVKWPVEEHRVPIARVEVCD